MTEAELRTGAVKSTSPVKAIHLLENFLRPFTILDFTSHDAIAYAHIRARLERAGTPIGPHDTIIAAQAVPVLGTGPHQPPPSPASSNVAPPHW